MMNRLKQMFRRWLGVNDTPESMETMKRETPRKAEDKMSAQLEEFLKEGYDFRFNVLAEQAEMCRKGEATYRPVNQRMANTLCLDARDRVTPLLVSTRQGIVFNH